MQRVSGLLVSIALLVALVVLCLVSLLGLGVIDINWPWENIDVASVDRTVTYDDVEPEPKIVRIEPIGLECHSRVFAEVPVRATREHQLVGQTYRTDSVEMVASGDVDTCVEADQVRVEKRLDGSFDVIIPAEAITFSRPRVDAVATMDSVVYDKGLIGKITDIFPWVSDNSSLTPAAYAFAQTVIGGSECMKQAYRVTELALRQAYANQLIEQGAADTEVDVLIDGTPDFAQNDLADDPKFDDFEFAIGGSAVQCQMSSGAIPAKSVEDL